jgi:hypothetical protein
MGVVQRRLGPVAGQLIDQSASAETPSRFGPRHCGQSAAFSGVAANASTTNASSTNMHRSHMDLSFRITSLLQSLLAAVVARPSLGSNRRCRHHLDSALGRVGHLPLGATPTQTPRRTVPRRRMSPVCRPRRLARSIDQRGTRNPMPSSAGENEHESSSSRAVSLAEHRSGSSEYSDLRWAVDLSEVDHDGPSLLKRDGPKPLALALQLKALLRHNFSTIPGQVPDANAVDDRAGFGRGL